MKLENFDIVPCSAREFLWTGNFACIQEGGKDYFFKLVPKKKEKPLRCLRCNTPNSCEIGVCHCEACKQRFAEGRDFSDKPANTYCPECTATGSTIRFIGGQPPTSKLCEWHQGVKDEMAEYRRDRFKKIDGIIEGIYGEPLGKADFSKLARAIVELIEKEKA